MNVLWPWVTLAALGAYHGINPGMGWLFALALGFQERSRQAILRSIVPIALGHAASVGAIVILVGIAQLALPEPVLRVLAGTILAAFGLYRLMKSRHPRWVGMRVGFRDLTLWSFLMASAHGAGLMLVPILLKWPAGSHAGHAMAYAGLMESTGAVVRPAVFLAAVGVHTASLLVVTGAIAMLVYEKLGLAFLRQSWFNFDLLWAMALLVAGVAAFRL